ncbi:MAG TPA: bifunctional DNA-formamidopyrimidine glycosylase/DNA-(apurinic or apyrimidinic site) lyase [Candidatus Methylomirabilis sp.]|nr:bifunctional DNA-formamidopyrimidine glycosylase/DNA-(apurinic or apyrimidinic site) lyase [Candidatus Methylomirabilis sp.]
MPELPEVETVARGLQRTIVGRRIVSVHLGKTDFIDDPAALEQHLPGRRIESVERYGKFMLLRLSPVNGDAPAALLVHLGMTGNIASNPVALPCEKHTHACFLLDDDRELRYTDPRRFGRLAYLTGGSLHDELLEFGADPLEIPVDEFIRQTRSRSSRIKALLLDQGFLRGVGNIYADESLWRAKIHPAQLGSKLNAQRAVTLHKMLREVLQKAIVLRGSSISDFRDSEGQPGEYQRHHRAYGREGKPCYRCGAVIRRAIVAGRSSYFCPQCQHAPRGCRALPLLRATAQKRQKKARR